MARLRPPCLLLHQALYRATLPTHVPLLRDWSDSELVELQSDELCAAVNAQRAHLRHTCERVRAAWVRLHPSYPPPSHERLEWAESIVRSRSLASAEGEARAMLLVPMFDLCNHAPAPPSCTAGVAPGGSGDGVTVDLGLQPPVLITSDGVVVLCARSALRQGARRPSSIEDALLAVC